MKTLSLPLAMREAIVEHARELHPRECCGVIIGPAGVLHELRKLTNVEPGVDRYLVDDTELFALTKELDERDWELTAIYHSHPISPACPSATDRELAFWPDAAYIICSLEHPDNPDVRAFNIMEDVVTELTVIVE